MEPLDNEKYLYYEDFIKLIQMHRDTQAKVSQLDFKLEEVLRNVRLISNIPEVQSVEKFKLDLNSSVTVHNKKKIMTIIVGVGLVIILLSVSVILQKQTPNLF